MIQSPHFSPASPKLSLFGASLIGVASMLGAGVFVVFSPASKLAGSFLLLAVLLAGVVAALNARSIRQLAIVLPKSGGAYSYAREFVSPGWGFVAGVAFVFGKIGSVAAIALAAAAYLYPTQRVEVAIVSVALMTLVNIFGINRTAVGAMILSAPTIALLALVGISGFVRVEIVDPTPFSITGVLSAAALIFFAFAGYARVATLGEEVRDPTKNVPRAISIGLVSVLVLYLLVANALQANLGSGLDLAITPVRDYVAVYLDWIPLEAVGVIAAAACLGSLLSLLAGISRTAESMARDGELPSFLAARGKRLKSPWVAEIAIASIAITLVLSGEITWTIGISSCAVLVYYAIANLAALRQLGSTRLWARVLAIAGATSCLGLALMVPVESLVLTSIILCLALLIRFSLSKLRRAN